MEFGGLYPEIQMGDGTLHDPRPHLLPLQQSGLHQPRDVGPHHLLNVDSAQATSLRSHLPGTATITYMSFCDFKFL